jgi:hypothetical protein
MSPQCFGGAAGVLRALPVRFGSETAAPVRSSLKLYRLRRSKEGSERFTQIPSAYACSLRLAASTNHMRLFLVLQYG